MDDGNQFGILSLLLEASIPVQIIVLVLIAMSVATWVIIFERAFTYYRLRQYNAKFGSEFWSGEPLSGLHDKVAGNASSQGEELIFRAAYSDYQKHSQKDRQKNQESVSEAVQRSIKIASLREEERLARGMSFFGAHLKL